MGRTQPLLAASSFLCAFSAVPDCPAADCDPAWAIVDTPVVGDGANALAGLAAVATNDVWVVGNRVEGAARHTLAQHWDGSHWTVMPSPDGSKQTSLLARAAAIATNDVWAVGFTTDDLSQGQNFTLIEHWDGKAWSVFPSPNLVEADVDPEIFGPYEVSNALYGVAAVSKDDVWAVGRSNTIVTGQGLIVHWDGKSWTVSPSQHPGNASWLYAVAAVSRDDVWAFGDHDQDGNQVTFIEHWDGKSWSTVDSPGAGPFLQMLLGASVVSRDDIWAVGYHLAVFGPREVYQTTILHWDGQEWTVVPSPNVNRENNYFYSISAIAPDNAIVVGFYDTGPPSPQILTLIATWDGESWKIIESLNTGDTDYLYSVAMVAAGDIWAVGQYFAGEIGGGTLAERFASTCSSSPFNRGDSNADGAVDISDAVFTLSYLFAGNTTPLCLDALDAEDNGAIEITDAVYLLQFLFQGGSPPPPPFPDAGADPTADAMECAPPG